MRRRLGGKPVEFQSLVRVVLNEHSSCFCNTTGIGQFQSLVRVVLNEHSGMTMSVFNSMLVSIPRSGCAE